MYLNIIKDIVDRPPISINTIRPILEKANPKFGIGLLEFNNNGSLLVSCNGIFIF